MSKKILYVLQSYYLDASIEHVLLLSQNVQLDVLIELAPESYHSTLIEFNNSNNFEGVVTFDKLRSYINIDSIFHYFKYCNSINFLVYKNNRSLSIQSYLTSRKAIQLFRKNDYIHFDDLSIRSFFYLPYILRKKIIINIHDPVPHTGEYQLKKQLIKKLYFFLNPRIQLFSENSRTLFIAHYGHSLRTHATRLLPYLCYINFPSTDISQILIDDLIKDKKIVLFFGRVAHYKGVSVFIKAIKHLLDDLDKNKIFFLMIGKPVHSFSFSESEDNLMTHFKRNFLYINKYMSVTELSEFIRKSDLVVCPYTEATQSGVIMTSYALSKPVIATNVGAFPEYVLSEEHLVAPNNYLELALSIQKYTEMPISVEFMNKAVSEIVFNSSKIIKKINNEIYE
jgi:glycosyltransferase involved in cell wall biosynthesis